MVIFSKHAKFLDFLGPICQNGHKQGDRDMAKIAFTQKNDQGRRTMMSAPKTFTKRQQQEIEKLAYQFFVDRGYEHGHDQEDWARAEAIVRNQRS